MNPYEVRLDVLKLARDILSENAKMESTKALSLHSASSTRLCSDPTSFKYDEKDVIKTATELYNFIQDKADRQ